MESTSAPQLTRVLSPTTREVIGEVAFARGPEVREAVRLAAAAQKDWSGVPVEERAVRILRFRDVIIERAEELVDCIVRETGKPRHEALLHEVASTADLITYYAKNASQILAPREIPLRFFRHRRSYVHFTPLGVVGVVTGWSLPFRSPMTSVVTALIAGSGAVVKPSSRAPLSAQLAKRIWDETKLPPDLFQVVTGDPTTALDLIQSGIHMAHFTGKVATARTVGAACAEQLIPCVLQLGGKAPLIACADADVQTTARAIAFGGFATTGQTCVAVERVYAHRDVIDRLLEQTVGLVQRLQQGDPGSGWVDVGSVSTVEQLEVIKGLVEDAVHKGATIATGGEALAGKGLFYPPTVLTDCNHDMRIMHEETFGPVVPFMSVDSDEQAVELANTSPRGLNAYVFTADANRGRRLAERVEAGSVLINDVFSNLLTPETPFGGVKQNAIGRIHGENALRDMCQLRHVSYDRVRPTSHNWFGFPYTPARYRWLLMGTRTLFSGGDVLKKIGDLL